jgi:hypothetical protein
MITNSNNNDNKSIQTLNSVKESKLKDSIPCRIEFIKDLMRDQQFDQLINFDSNKSNISRNIIKDSSLKSEETYDTRITLKKKILNFTNVISELGSEGKLEYIKSGTTGHTFKGTAKNGDGNFEYAVKVVAYPKKTRYGSIYDSRRPENAEIMMIKLLSNFILKKQTPHIVLPIGTFNTNIKTFIGLIDQNVVENANEKYRDFEEKYKENKYHEDVSILISEWANNGDLLEFIRKHYKKFEPITWKVIFFQIISTLAVIQSKYPAFRHNDLKANNILVQKIQIDSKKFTYRVARNEYKVPNIGYQIKIWDFDFACIPNEVPNIKVSSSWTKEINVIPEQNRYYDIHYFFNTLIKRGFFHQFMLKDCVPQEAKDFVNRIVPKKYQEFNKKNKYVHERGRILVTDEYLLPDDILKNDPYFEEFRTFKIDKTKEKEISGKIFKSTKQENNIKLKKKNINNSSDDIDLLKLIKSEVKKK